MFKLVGKEEFTIGKQSIKGNLYHEIPINYLFGVKFCVD